MDLKQSEMWQTLLLLQGNFDLNKNSKLMNVLNSF
jgi:hypothetical protein